MAKPSFARLNLEDPGPDLDPWEGAATKVRDELAERAPENGDGGGPDRDELRRLALREWAIRVPEGRGPLDLERFAYQREWYDDHGAYDREQIDMKANQVGDSTKAIRVAMFHADRGAVVIYAFPTEVMLRKFSRQRIAPAIRGSDYLRSRMTREHVNTVDQKQIGWGWIYFFGTENPVEATDADMLFVDEYDFCNQANIEQTERRVTGPMSAGLIRRLGIPTLPGYGIAKLYDETDQRAWTVHCQACGEWNRIYGFDAWRDNVDQELLAVVCRKCRKPLDVRIGEWVARYPDRDVRGYHVPKLIVPGLRLDVLVRNSRKTAPVARQAFHNRDLGVPYAPAEGRLSIEALRACERREFRVYEGLPRSGRPRFLAADQASARPMNVIVREQLDMESTRLVFAGEVEDAPGGRTAFETLVFLMEAFQVNMACIDNGPDGRLARAFVARFPGRAYRVAYYDEGKDRRREAPVWNVDDPEGYVSLHRTKAIDATLDNFRLQRSLIPPLDMLPRDDEGRSIYAEHLGNLVAQTEDTPSGNKRRFYVKTGDDDYAHVEVYNLTAVELYWRNAGIGQVRGQGPTPLADQVDFTRSHLADWDVEPEYRPGLGDDWDPGGGEGLE